jgi:hypothetical protein
VFYSFSHTPLIRYPTNTMIMSYKSGLVPPSDSDDQKDDHDYGGGGAVARPAEKVIIRKRFRTNKRTEGKDVELCREGWLEDAEA